MALFPLFPSFVVAISILQVAFGRNDNTAPKKGSSLDSQAMIPPQVNSVFTAPVDGNFPTVFAIADDSGMNDGNVAAEKPEFMWKANDGSIYFTDAKNSCFYCLKKDATVITYMGLYGSGSGGDGDNHSMAQLKEPRGISGSDRGIWIQAIRVSEQ